MSESDEPTNRRLSPAAVWGIALGLISLPVLYVLSIGPAILLFNADGVPDWVQSGVSWYVLPMELAEIWFPAITPWVDGYVKLWI
jgi:hypothetical protein